MLALGAGPVGPPFWSSNENHIRASLVGTSSGLTPFLGLAPASNRNIAMSLRIEGPSEYVDGEPPLTKATLNRTMLNNLATACAALALALAMVPATAQETGRTRVGHAHLQHIARCRHDCRGTAATELHLRIGERQGARSL
jgi:hypothetical protein